MAVRERAARELGRVAGVGTAVDDVWGAADLANLRGLAKPDEVRVGLPSEMPGRAQEIIRDCLRQGTVRIGGQGNTLPQVAATGLEAFGISRLGAHGGGRLDAGGEFFTGQMERYGVRMCTQADLALPTGTTFIVQEGEGARPGIVYFPNANLATDLDQVYAALERTKPDVMHWMYVGLMGRADLELPGFLRKCRETLGCITSADTHTLATSFGLDGTAGQSSQSQNPHAMLRTVLPELDVFFCSMDEALLISRALGMNLTFEPNEAARNDGALYRDARDTFIQRFLGQIYYNYADYEHRRPLFGVTVSDGAFYRVAGERPLFVPSRFLCQAEGINLVGAGDAFRAGVLSYVATNAQEFREARLNYRHAVEMGTLFATLSITARGEDRVENFASYETLEALVQSPANYSGGPLTELLRDLGRTAPV